MKVRDKVVWVTGASSGIGEALAIELSSRGALLVISARREQELEKVREKCQGDNVLIVPLDLEEESSIRSAVENVLSSHRKIDILINNAGISQRSMIMETDPEVMRRIMEINFFGTISLTREVLPHMITSGGGQIATISSVVGKFGTPKRSAYSASKHALHGFFDSLRAEHWKDQIKVTMICPGFVHTQISMNALTGSGEKQMKMDTKTAQGLTPGVFARKAVRAIEKEKEEVYIGRREIMAVYLKRFFPRMLSKALRKVNVT